MAWAQVTVGDAIKASDINNLMSALENMLTTSGYLNSAAPASAGASGTAGHITYDTSYIYVCTATDTWKRVGIATW